MKNTIFGPWKSPWLAGQFVIWILLFIGSFLTTLFLQYTNFDAAYLPVLVYSINALSLLTGGFVAGRKAKRKGWFYGGAQGIIYTLLLFLISFLAFDSMIQINLFLFLICTFGLSAIGGIFGASIK